MSDSFFRERAGLYYDSDDIGEELDDFFRSGFFESLEEDDDGDTNGKYGGSDNEVTDSPKIIIFIVEGLRKQIDSDSYAHLEVPRSKIIHIPLAAQQAINDSQPYNGLLNQANRLLNIVLSHLPSDASNTSPMALGFLASDLAASIVKKALVIASEDSHYSSIIDQTSLLVFFETLHRVSTIGSWELVLSEWARAYCEERPMLNPLDLVGPLAAFHRQLSLEFDTIMRCHSMRTVNYYEMDSESKIDDKYLSRFNATFGGHGQAHIATPDMSSRVRLHHDQTQFLERKIQDEIDHLKSDYLGGLELLALHSPISHIRPGHSMRFDSLAKYIISRPDLQKWLQGANIPSLTRSAWAKVARPLLFTHIKSIIADSLNGLHEGNMEWIDRILGLCVKSLLIGAHTVSVLIIIEQPEYSRVTAPFVDLIYLMKRFIETTETATRIVILSRQVHQGVAIDDINIAAPVYWDFDDIGIPTMKIDIDTTSPQVRDALINDYTDIIADSSLYDQSQIVKADAELLALNNLTKLEAYRAAVALAQKPPFYMSKPREYSPDSDNISQYVVSRILDLLPKSMEKIVWAGLHWLITAHRPLTCQEFAFALQHEESDAAIAIVNHGQATLTPITVFEFVSLFYGLIEINENRICLSDVLHSHLSSDESEESPILKPPFNTWLHKDTAKNATSGASEKQCNTEEQEQTEQETQLQIPTLLPYAIEHWFEFLLSDYFNGEEKVTIPILKKAVEEFVADETMLNRYLHVYKSKVISTCFTWNITVPSLSRIQERLDLSISDAMAVALAPIRRHSPLALDSGWQYVALGVTESKNEAALLKADLCKMFDDEKILKLAFEIASDKSSCVLAKSHPDFVQKYSAKLLNDAICLGNSSFVTHIVSQGDTLTKDYDVPEAGATILSSMAEFVAPIAHPILWQKYLRHMRHMSEAHKQDKRSALHLAAISGHSLFIEQAITWMKDHNVDPAEALNDRDQFGATALFLASQHGHFDIVTQLIAAGAKLAICDKHKQSPLHIACKMGNSKIVAKLVAAGAKPDGQDRLNKTPLHLALENRHIVRELAATRNLQLQPHKLLWFLQNEHYDIEKLRILLENGMDPNLIIGEYGSMLHYAALWGRLDLVELLCKFDRVDINMIHPNKTHGTPLQLAAFLVNDNGPKIIEILLARDANVYKGSGFYGTALNVAAAMPRLKDDEEKIKVEAAYIHMAKLLISHEKMIINFSAGYHRTPIQFAVASGSYGMFEFLLTQEPILSRPTGASGTVLHHAAYTSRSKTLQTLLSNAKFDLLGLQPLHLAAGVGSRMGISYILRQHGNAVNDKDADGWTALHWACRGGINNKAAVELLLKSGADKNATTDRGWTAFDVALYSGGSVIDDPELHSLIKPDKRHGVAPFYIRPGIALDEEEVLPPRTSTTPRSANGNTYNCDVCYVFFYLFSK
ncbi:ankyrin repeat-containing domain protein [Trichoderma pleuroticola]